MCWLTSPSLVNPEDDSNLLRIINTPARGISAGTIERATEWSARNKCAVWNALQADEFLRELPARTVGKIAEFVALIDSYETKLNEPLSDHHAVAGELLKEVAYIEDLKRTCKDGGGGDEARGECAAVIRGPGDVTWGGRSTGCRAFWMR